SRMICRVCSDLRSFEKSAATFLGQVLIDCFSDIMSEKKTQCQKSKQPQFCTDEMFESCHCRWPVAPADD
ncbi:hypothetical protein ACFL0S_13540, partial [Thermodesulfobacteriota bacterium]